MVLFYGIYWEIVKFIEKRGYHEFPNKFSFVIISFFILMNILPLYFNLTEMINPNIHINGWLGGFLFILPVLLFCNIMLYFVFVFKRDVKKYIRKYINKPIQFRIGVKILSILFVLVSISLFYIGILSNN